MGVYLGSTQVDMQGGFVTGGASGASLQSKTVSPSESAQTIKADNGYDGLSQVTVNAVSRTYVGSGVTKKSAATYTPGTSDQSIASGQYLNGTQTIKGDSNLTAGNIRSGVKIFNVTGSYAGSSSSGGINKTPKWVGKVTASSLNVRKWAGKEYGRIKSYPYLYRGNLVDVCDTVKAADGKAWYYIRIAGKYYGFVSSDYIVKA